ncbi:hypothetical protein BT96DRAFT_876512 [Gymnopus androsaceus JB14]|uniref:Uncharacterized protein n=1 Tax=Gymnopus androsaceus JB14 TaxID=1447944 RepID=A0A6A4I9X9_9AGAR|nr:hypothetical protein BT96DRAFT_876512 [Gymnopus androsaceus JB14]
MQTWSKTTSTVLSLCKAARKPHLSHASITTSSQSVARSLHRDIQFRASVGRNLSKTTTRNRYDILKISYSYSSLASSTTKVELETELAPGTFSDPTRAGLFYHYLAPPTPVSPAVPVYALSFLPSPPSSADSNTIIGWLPAGTDSNGEEGAGLNDFKENPKFRQLLHEVIQSGLKADVDDIQRNGALQVQQGWMHIHDERNIPALGRIGDPDDIIASVLVEDGKIKSETYQPMPAYRLCTSDGLIQLTEGLSTYLQKILVETSQGGKKRALAVYLHLFV